MHNLETPPLTVSAPMRKAAEALIRAYDTQARDTMLVTQIGKTPSHVDRVGNGARISKAREILLKTTFAANPRIEEDCTADGECKSFAETIRQIHRSELNDSLNHYLSEVASEMSVTFREKQPNFMGNAGLRR